MNSVDDKLKAERDARDGAELAAAIEKCWRSRFGSAPIPVVAAVALAEIRRGNG